MRHLLLALAILLLATVPAAARPGHHGPGGRGGPLAALIERHAEELGIDSATLDQVRAVAETHRSDGKAIREQVAGVRKALREVLHQPRPDEAEVVALAAELGALETEANTIRLLSMVRTRALLTPEQNEALLELLGRGYEGKREAAEAALVACQPEVERFCSDVAGPPFMALGCLMHGDEVELGPQCSEALESLPERGMRGRRGGRFGRH